ncbi:MAG: RagB/SusD family nutrient uptake outer membrane protein [Bacteroidales bacterium]|nr:RagB/SusD family nutrient uptake outer membrane protein [Bacteroidales bacterium]
MKNIIVLLTIFSLLITGCEEFLKEEQVHVLGYGEYQTEEGCLKLINSCYSSVRLKAGGEWSYGLFNLGTDEYMRGYECKGAPYGWDEYNDYLPELDGHEKGQYGDIGDWWAVIYEGINRCNLAIELIPNIENAEGDLKTEEGRNTALAEVRFLRAYQYFILVQQFGAIPFTWESTGSAREEWPRVPTREVYAKILEDLEWSYNNIPETQDLYGKVTKDAVRHYWAKVLLTRASYIADPADDPEVYDRGCTDPDAELAKAAALIEEIHAGGRHTLIPDYADLFKEGKEFNPEVIFSAQFSDDQGLNESNGSAYKNAMHEYWFQRYDYPTGFGVIRNIEYGRPFRRMMITDYAINIHDRLNDSRLRKSLLEVYYSTVTDAANIPVWTQEEIAFAFEFGNSAPDGSWAIKDGDTIRPGDMKFTSATAADGEYVNVGDTALVFLLNDENTTLTDRQMVAAGYLIFARYYWATDASGNPTELLTYDREDDELNWESSGNFVVGASNIRTNSWTRDHAPSLIKYWDRNKPDGYDSHVGSRDLFIARLGESYLIAAEAYGRLKNYAKAVEFINYVRERAGYADGEVKTNFWMQYDGGSAANLTASTKTNMRITDGYWNTDADELATYPAGVDTDEERFIAFILNERCREMLGEQVRWEDLVRTGTLIDRAGEFNNDAKNAKSLQKFHRVRPFPEDHLDAIKSGGDPLTPQAKKAYQNEGYY